MTHSEDAPPCVPLDKGYGLVDGTFLDRPSQMVLMVHVDGAPARVHMADRGRLKGVLTPDRTLILARRPEPGRKTAYQAMAAVMDDGTLVSLDTHSPNRLVKQALERRLFSPLADLPEIKREVTIGHSRYDFVARGPQGSCVLEVKSAGHIAADRIARFPDAVTERGRRHVLGLRDLAAGGQRTALLFVVQGEARAVTPYRAVDPAFAEALEAAAEAGVELYAQQCPLTRAGLIWGSPCPVILNL
ncbi:MAG: DNA/RNA nuclease SfsA [Bradymonadia bacterium]